MKISQLAVDDMKSRREEEFQRAVKKTDDVADIAVVGDGGWGKRSLGHSYDSLTGMIPHIIDSI